MSAPLAAALAVIGVAAVYAFTCWRSPYGPCLRCSGRGRRKSLILRRDGDCWWCRSSGARLRLGRRAYNLAAKWHREGQAHRTEREAAKR